MTATQPDPRRAIRKLNLIGLAIAVLLIGGVGGWATTTHLAGAVIASGSIVGEAPTRPRLRLKTTTADSSAAQVAQGQGLIGTGPCRPARREPVPRDSSSSFPRLW